MSMIMISKKTYQRVEQRFKDLKLEIEALKDELRITQELVE